MSRKESAVAVKYIFIHRLCYTINLRISVWERERKTQSERALCTVQHSRWNMITYSIAATDSLRAVALCFFISFSLFYTLCSHNCVFANKWDRKKYKFKTALVYIASITQSPNEMSNIFFVFVNNNLKRSDCDLINLKNGGEWFKMINKIWIT